MSAGTLIDRTRARTATVREDEAGKLLGWDEVTKAIGLAAGRGQSQTIFSPPVGLNLKDAPTTAATVARLEGGGFRCEWIERRELPDGERYHALRVSWS